MSGATVGKSYSVGAWFRGDWAGDAPQVAGVEMVLANPTFLDAAKRLFDVEVVIPRIVYVNLMAPMESKATSHVDIPIFRGIQKPEYPVWMLHVMQRSGLFEHWKVKVATAVSWFYEGEGGSFDYWADGPDSPPHRIEAPLSNRAVMGDNDVMFHRIGSIGAPGAAPLEGATNDAELVPSSGESDEWCVVDGGRELARYTAKELRISISWKAEVYADAEAARIRSERTDDLDLEKVVDLLVGALADAGQPTSRPSEPLHDTDFIDRLNELFPLPALTG